MRWINQEVRIAYGNPCQMVQATRHCCCFIHMIVMAHDDVIPYGTIVVVHITVMIRDIMWYPRLPLTALQYGWNIAVAAKLLKNYWYHQRDLPYSHSSDFKWYECMHMWNVLQTFESLCLKSLAKSTVATWYIFSFRCILSHTVSTKKLEKRDNNVMAIHVAESQ